MSSQREQPDSQRAQSAAPPGGVFAWVSAGLSDPAGAPVPASYLQQVEVAEALLALALSAPRPVLPPLIGRALYFLDRFSGDFCWIFHTRLLNATDESSRPVIETLIRAGWIHYFGGGRPQRAPRTKKRAARGRAPRPGVAVHPPPPPPFLFRATDRWISPEALRSPEALDGAWRAAVAAHRGLASSAAFPLVVSSRVTPPAAGTPVRSTPSITPPPVDAVPPEVRQEMLAAASPEEALDVVLAAHVAREALRAALIARRAGADPLALWVAAYTAAPPPSPPQDVPWRDFVVDMVRAGVSWSVANQAIPLAAWVDAALPAFRLLPHAERDVTGGPLHTWIVDVIESPPPRGADPTVMAAYSRLVAHCAAFTTARRADPARADAHIVAVYNGSWAGGGRTRVTRASSPVDRVPTGSSARAAWAGALPAAAEQVFVQQPLRALTKEDLGIALWVKDPARPLPTRAVCDGWVARACLLAAPDAGVAAPSGRAAPAALMTPRPANGLALRGPLEPARLLWRALIDRPRGGLAVVAPIWAAFQDPKVRVHLFLSGHYGFSADMLSNNAVLRDEVFAAVHTFSLTHALPLPFPNYPGAPTGAHDINHLILRDRLLALLAATAGQQPIAAWLSVCAWCWTDISPGGTSQIPRAVSTLLRDAFQTYPQWRPAPMDLLPLLTHPAAGIRAWAQLLPAYTASPATPSVAPATTPHRPARGPGPRANGTQPSPPKATRRP